MATTTVSGSQLFEDALVWDMTFPWSLAADDASVLPRYRRSGFDLVSLTTIDDRSNALDALTSVALIRNRIKAHPDAYVLVESAEDIAAAKRDGKLALTFNAQGTLWLGTDLNLVESFYRLGLRHMLLAYQVRNRVADGCAERTDGGLSKFGMRLIAEMNRVGMLVDTTHTGYRSSMDAMEASSAPCIISHSNASSVYEHYRNVRDDQIKACARTGGVIGINAMGAFLSAEPATPEIMFRHIDYMVSLVGPEHVGIGTDYVANPEHLHEIQQASLQDYWPDNNGRPGVGVSSFVQIEEVNRVAEIMLGHG